MFSIDDNHIERLLSDARNSGHRPHDILSKAEKRGGLDSPEAAALLVSQDEAVWGGIYRLAGRIKKEIYGDRVVLFAPLYVSDHCVNECSYCGFRLNGGHKRRKLTTDEIRAEVEILARMGHKRLALEAGEDAENCGIDYITDCIKTIYDTKTPSGGIRRVNVNIAAASVDDYKKLKGAGIGTYILFQETYSREAYAKYHLSGPKADFDHHLTAFDRANAAGIDDVGAGVLFGLHDWRFELLALMEHNKYLESTYGAGFHTISVPRVRGGGAAGLTFPHAVSDGDLKKIVALLRVAVPYVGLIISTREDMDMRRDLINLGVSQISGGSSVEVGGYSARDVGRDAPGALIVGRDALGAPPSDAPSQFDVVDGRNASEIIYWLMEEGLVPSFCTACYRMGRTGEGFMDLAKTGAIKDVCLPNALLTLKEYALDYGDERFRGLAEDIIAKHMENIADEAVRGVVKRDMMLMEQGVRDLFV